MSMFGLVNFSIWMIYGFVLVTVYGARRSHQLRKRVARYDGLSVNELNFKGHIDKADLLGFMAIAIDHLNGGLMRYLCMLVYSVLAVGVNTLLWPVYMLRVVHRYDELEDELNSIVRTNNLVAIRTVKG